MQHERLTNNQNPHFEYFLSDRNLEVLDIIGLHKITGTYFIRIPEDMPKLRLLNLQQCNRVRMVSCNPQHQV